MPTNYFAPIQEERSRGSATRIGILQRGLEENLDDKRRKERSFLSMLSDPSYTIESRKAFNETRDPSVLKSIQEKSIETKDMLERQKDAAREEKDSQFVDFIKGFRDNSGKFDVDALRKNAHLVGPEYQLTIQRIINNSESRQPRNIDPHSKAGINARIEYLKRLRDEGLSKSDGNAPRYDDAAYDMMNQYGSNIASTERSIEEGYDVTRPSWLPFIKPKVEKEQYSESEIDSMVKAKKEYSDLMKGAEEWMAGKKTWRAQKYQEMIDEEYKKELEEEERLNSLEEGE